MPISASQVVPGDIEKSSPNEEYNLQLFPDTLAESIQTHTRKEDVEEICDSSAQQASFQNLEAEMSKLQLENTSLHKDLKILNKNIVQLIEYLVESRPQSAIVKSEGPRDSTEPLRNVHLLKQAIREVVPFSDEKKSILDMSSAVERELRLEVGAMKQKIAEQEQQLRDNITLITEKDLKLAEVGVEIMTLKASLNQRESAANCASQRLASALKELGEIKIQLIHCKASCDEAVNHQRTLEQKLEVSKTSLELCQRAKDIQNQSYEKLERENAHLMREAGDAIVKVSEQDNRISTLLNELEATQTELHRKDMTVQQMEALFAESESVITLSTKRISETKGEAESLQNRVVSLEKELESVRRMFSQQTEKVQSLENIVARLKEGKHEFQKKWQQISLEYADMKGRMESLSTELVDLRAENEVLSSLNAESTLTLEKKIHILEADKLELEQLHVNSQNEIIKESQLSTESLSCQIEHLEKREVELKCRLKESRMATQKASQAADVATRALQTAEEARMCVESKLQSKEAESLDLRREVATLRDSLRARDESAKQSDSNIFYLENEVARLRDELRHAEDKVARLEEMRCSLISERDDLKLRLRESKSREEVSGAELHSMSEKVSVLSKSVKQLREDAAKKEAATREKDETQEVMEARIADLSLKIKNMQKREHELEALLSESQVASQQVSQAADDAALALQAKDMEVLELRRQVETLRDSLASRDASVKEMGGGLADAADRQTHLENEVTRLQAALRLAEAQVVSVEEAQLAAMSERSAELNMASRELEAQKVLSDSLATERRSVICEMEAAKKETELQVGKLSQVVAKLRNRENELGGLLNESRVATQVASRAANDASQALLTAQSQLQGKEAELLELRKLVESLRDSLATRDESATETNSRLAANTEVVRLQDELRVVEAQIMNVEEAQRAAISDKYAELTRLDVNFHDLEATKLARQTEKMRSASEKILPQSHNGANDCTEVTLELLKELRENFDFLRSEMGRLQDDLVALRNEVQCVDKTPTQSNQDPNVAHLQFKVKRAELEREALESLSEIELLRHRVEQLAQILNGASDWNESFSKVICEYVLQCYSDILRMEHTLRKNRLFNHDFSVTTADESALGRQYDMLDRKSSLTHEALDEISIMKEDLTRVRHKRSVCMKGCNECLAFVLENDEKITKTITILDRLKELLGGIRSRKESPSLAERKEQADSTLLRQEIVKFISDVKQCSLMKSQQNESKNITSDENSESQRSASYQQHLETQQRDDAKEMSVISALKNVFENLEAEMSKLRLENASLHKELRTMNKNIVQLAEFLVESRPLSPFEAALDGTEPRNMYHLQQAICQVVTSSQESKAKLEMFSAVERDLQLEITELSRKCAVQEQQLQDSVTLSTEKEHEILSMRHVLQSALALLQDRQNESASTALHVLHSVEQNARFEARPERCSEEMRMQVEELSTVDQKAQSKHAADMDTLPNFNPLLESPKNVNIGNIGAHVVYVDKAGTSSHELSRGCTDSNLDETKTQFHDNELGMTHELDTTGQLYEKHEELLFDHVSSGISQNKYHPGTSTLISVQAELQIKSMTAQISSLTRELEVLREVKAESALQRLACCEMEAAKDAAEKMVTNLSTQVESLQNQNGELEFLLNESQLAKKKATEAADDAKRVLQITEEARLFAESQHQSIETEKLELCCQVETLSNAVGIRDESAKKMDSRITLLESEVARLEDELRDADAQMDDQRTLVSEQTAELNRLERSLRELEAEKLASDAEMRSMADKILMLTEDLEAFRVAKEFTSDRENEFRQLVITKESLEKQASESSLELQILKKRQEELEVLMSESEMATQKASLAAEDATRVLQSTEEARLCAESNLQSKDAESLQLHRQMEILRDSLAARDESVKVLNNHLIDATNRQIHLESVVSRFQRELEAEKLTSDTEIRSMSDQLSALTEELQAAKLATDQLKQEHHEEVAGVSKELEKIKAESDSLRLLVVNLESALEKEKGKSCDADLTVQELQRLLTDVQSKMTSFKEMAALSETDREAAILKFKMENMSMKASFRKENTTLLQKNSELSSKLANAAQTIASQDATLEDLKRSLEKSDDALSQLREASKRRIEDVEASISELKQCLALAKDEALHFRCEVDRLQKQCKSLEETADIAASKHDHEREHAEAQYQLLNEAVARLETTIVEERKLSEDKTMLICELEDKVQILVNEKLALEKLNESESIEGQKRVHDLNNVVTKLKQQLVKSESDSKLLKERISEHCRELEQSRLSKSKTEKMLAEAKGLCATLKVKLQDSEKTRYDLENKVSDTESTSRKFEKDLSALEGSYTSTVVQLNSNVNRLRQQRNNCKSVLRLQKFCIVSQKLLLDKYREITSSHKSFPITKNLTKELEERTDYLNAKVEESTRQYRLLFSQKASSTLSKSDTIQLKTKSIDTSKCDVSQVYSKDIHTGIVPTGNCGDFLELEGDCNDLDELSLFGAEDSGDHGLKSSLRQRDEGHLMSTAVLLDQAEELASNLSDTVGKVQRLDFSGFVTESE